MKEESCYYCGAKATSREHVPPLAIFPQQKDFDGIDFRSNLITVPSCEIHNQKKSNDDEFLMACLSGVVGNPPYTTTLTSKANVMGLHTTFYLCIALCKADFRTVA